MTPKVSGGCACGAVRYEATAEPVFMLNCHCRDCQRASGGSFAAIAVLPGEAVKVTGEPRYHVVTGGSGHQVERGFCPICGSPVAIKLARMPDIFGVHAASLDDPSLFKPTVDLFTASAHSWDHMDPDLPKRPRGMKG
jgi:hypothetical protein